MADALRKPLSLQPKQHELLLAVLDRRPSAPSILGFGGARGSAKSGAIRRIALLLATGQQGVIIWIIRRVWDDLNKDHVMPLFTEYPELKPFYRAGNKELRFTNGSSIFFIHAGDTGRAKRKARGPQAHYIFLEQAEEFSQEEMEQLAGSNRAPGVPPGFCKRIFTFNPGGIGTNYLRRIFYLKEYRDNENPGDFLFIQGFGWDNYEWFRGLGIVSERDFYHSPAWDEERRFKVFVEQTDFGRKLNSLPPNQRIGELMGSFENFSGQYYAGVWEQSTLVLPPDLVARMIQPWWPRWLATDWGFSHYSATVWLATGLLSPAQIQEYFGVPA
ncbi:MAG TPA: phage terminase large subunit, partial [Candidatus Binataceae bacterium]|nr:phage terminase large subunit [Candidatus Binataceae bacterium]